jgi:hypothetical protein
MPVFTQTSLIPRQELAMAIVEGEGAVRGIIGDKILPDFPINKRTAHLIKATLADTQGLRIIASQKFVHAPGAKYERIVATLDDATMGVTLRGQEIVVPNEVKMDYAEYLDVEGFFAGRFGTETSALTKEYLIAAQIFNTTNFGAATNSLVAYTTANASTNSFIADVIAATRLLKSAGEPGPYIIAMSGPVFERIRQAATVQGYAAGTLKAGMEANKGAILEALREFGVEDLLIGDSYYNTAPDQATPSLTQIWSNTYMFVGRPGMANAGSETDGIGVPTMGGVGVNTFWEGFMPGGTPSTDKEAKTFPGGNYVESYPDLSLDSMIVRVKMSSQPFIGNARCGTLVATQYS